MVIARMYFIWFCGIISNVEKYEKGFLSILFCIENTKNQSNHSQCETKYEAILKHMTWLCINKEGLFYLFCAMEIFLTNKTVCVFIA